MAEPRNAETAVPQAWSDFLAKAQLDAELRRHLNAPDVRFARAAFEAGAVSRQEEVDRLREAVAMVSTAMAQAALAKSIEEVRIIRSRLKAAISEWQDRG